MRHEYQVKCPDSSLRLHWQAVSVHRNTVRARKPARNCYCPVTHKATLGEIAELLHQFVEILQTFLEDKRYHKRMDKKKANESEDK